MKFLSALLIALTAVPLSYTKEIAPNAELAAQFYDNGYMHETLMSKKMATFEKNRNAGKYVSSFWKKLQTYKPCTDGVVKYDKNTTFQCNNVDLRYFLSHADMGSATGEGSSMWGWTSPDGREIAVIGQADGAAFVEVKKDGSLDYLGRLPQQSVPSIWREIRVFKNYAVIGSEAVGHNVQIFDLRKVLNVKPWWNPFAKPKVFDPTKDLTSLFTGLPIGRTHNIVINEAKDYAVAVGAQPRNSTCKSGLIFIDLVDPSKPTTPGCAEQDGYVHDAQCLPYKGPDKRFAGKDICYGYNEDTLTIYDVTDRTNTSIISRTSYTGASYTHQGWVLDTEDQKFLISDDELDEQRGAGPGGDGFPVSFIWDIRDLTAPKQTGYYKSKVKSIDHNQYVLNKWVYQSNYGAGLRILDLSSVERDPTGKSVKEVGFFDIYPEDDLEEGGGIADFVGTWASYPYFKSGWLLINTIERGLFSVKYRKSGTN